MIQLRCPRCGKPVNLQLLDEGGEPEHDCKALRWERIWRWILCFPPPKEPLEALKWK